MRSRCYFSTLIVLLLCAAPGGAAADELVCSPIGRGDTATTLARRLMGSAAAAYSEAFQIRDPTRRMYVPKSQYQRLKPHWEVCVTPRRAAGPPMVPPAAPTATDASITAPVALAMSSAAVPAATHSSSDARALGPAAGIAGLLLLVMAAAGATWLVPRSIPVAMQQAGEAFIAAFARPLIDPSSSSPPIETRVRFVRRKQQLEISIAPGPGRRYPNLADHKKNVEYDVERVLRVLGNRAVLGEPMRARGKWVVVPVRLTDGTSTGDS